MCKYCVKYFVRLAEIVAFVAYNPHAYPKSFGWHKTHDVVATWTDDRSTSHKVWYFISKIKYTACRPNRNRPLTIDFYFGCIIARNSIVLVGGGVVVVVTHACQFSIYFRSLFISYFGCKRIKSTCDCVRDRWNGRPKKRRLRSKAIRPNHISLCSSSHENNGNLLMENIR